jgi:dynein heavy chain, axonemal
VLSLVVNQTSLDQFLELFVKALTTSEPALTSKHRVTNIISCFTHSVVSYIVRGLYNEHKLLFKVLYALKLCVAYSLIPPEVPSLLATPAVASASAPTTKPFVWMSAEVRDARNHWCASGVVWCGVDLWLPSTR